jgi:ethanolamine ammonia-lyase large subunit
MIFTLSIAGDLSPVFTALGKPTIADNFTLCRQGLADHFMGNLEGASVGVPVDMSSGATGLL